MLIDIRVNGTGHQVAARNSEMLVDTLRALGYKSVKRGCETASCGVCHVLVDGKLVPSCAYPTVRAQGKQITTVEGIAEEIRPIAEAIVAQGAEQCGFCSPGTMMAIVSTLRNMRQEPAFQSQSSLLLYLKHELAGSMCRCSGYEGQHRALLTYIETYEPQRVTYLHPQGRLDYE